MKRYIRIACIVISFLYLALLQSGCNDSGIVTPPSPHFEAEGMIIKSENLSDTVLYVFRGQFKAGFDSLKIPYGTISPHWNVFFLNSDTVTIDPPSDNDKTLGWTIANPLILEMFQDDPASEPWAFHLRGLNVGSTTIELKIVHINHSDFTTPPIPVIVDPNIIGEAVGYKVWEEKTGELIYRDSLGVQTGPGFQLASEDTTEHTVIQFYDKSGSLFTPPFPQYDLSGAVQNSSIAEFLNQAPKEPFVFRIRGILSGNTGIFLQLKEGSKVIYTPQNPLPINVTP